LPRTFLNKVAFLLSRWYLARGDMTWGCPVMKAVWRRMLADALKSAIFHKQRWKSYSATRTETQGTLPPEAQSQQKSTPLQWVNHGLHTSVSIILVLVRGGVHSTFIFFITLRRNTFVSSVWSWSRGGKVSPVASSSLYRRQSVLRISPIREGWNSEEEEACVIRELVD
jgi:hypothetical protein